MLTVLTPTGGRPEAFAECARQMAEQTYEGNVHWIIVDDCQTLTHVPPMPRNWSFHHLRPTPFWQPGQNTLSRNILEGLKDVSQQLDRLVIVEDDDRYAPWWLHVCNRRLDTHDLIGESHSLYISRRTGRERPMGNVSHASMCSTALKGPVIGMMEAVCEDNPKGQGLDVFLWQRMQRAHPDLCKLYAPEPRGVTGIKGWPGRPGIGVGHRL